MTIKDQLNQIKPETGENSKMLKSIIEDIDSKLVKALENNKDYVFFKTSNMKLFKDVLSDVRLKMIYHIMLLQKCQEEPLKSQIEGDTEQRLAKVLEDNRKLVIRNHWLENYMKLKMPYYALEAENLPKMKKA